MGRDGVEEILANPAPETTRVVRPSPGTPAPSAAQSSPGPRAKTAHFRGERGIGGGSRRTMADGRRRGDRPTPDPWFSSPERPAPDASDESDGCFRTRG